MLMQLTKQISGVTYYILSEPREIRDYVLAVAQKEWDPDDFTKYGDDLENSNWQLEEVDVDAIQFGPSQPNPEDLEPRIVTQLEILKNNISVPPLILRGTDLLIFDGYARTNSFRKMGIKKCLAYVGR
jgi:hypothetical protein